MYVASKFEEVYSPTIDDLIFITDKAYSHLDIINMEESILISLDFDLHVGSSYRFLERYSRIVKFDQIAFYLS